MRAEKWRMDPPILGISKLSLTRCTSELSCPPQSDNHARSARSACHLRVDRQWCGSYHKGPEAPQLGRLGVVDS